MTSFLRDEAGGVLVDVLVSPRASRTRIAGVQGDRLKIQVAAPPVDGEANAALCELLADVLGVARRQVTLVAGETGRRKTVRIEALDRETAGRVLASKGP